MLLVFWGAAACIVFTYIVMPVVVLARGLVVRRPVAAADVTPSVSVVIAAYNEAASIGAKIANVLACDYPADRVQLVVASDGSSDATAEVARRAADDRTVVLELPRLGKADALNEALRHVTGEIVVFTDANSMLAADALRRLVRPFADGEVGGVAGDQRYAGGGEATGERRYWDLDRLLKVAESRSGNTISATGALYAVRRSLLAPVVAGVTDDFYTSTGVIRAGQRLVFEGSAVAYEPPAPSTGREFDRKVRIMTRGLRGVAVRRDLLDPRVSGFYAVQLLWHKVLRRVVAIPLVLLLVSSPFLARRGPLYRLAAAAQAVFYGCAVAGLVTEGSPAGRWRRLLSLPAYFCMVNAAALRAVLNLVTGNRVERWETARAEPDKSP